MARGYHVVDFDAEADLLDDLPEWEPSGASVVRSQSAIPRVISGGGSGFGASALGLNAVGCPGCRDTPWSDCAACGKPAVIALPDPDPTVPHSLPLCARCWAVLLEWREKVNAPKAPRSTRRNPHLRYSDEELDRIREMRLAGKLWREIAVSVGGSIEGCRQAYHRERNRARWTGYASSGPMVSSTPDIPRSPAISSPAVVPKTRQRPAQDAGRNHHEPTSARASVKPKRDASPVVRPPLPSGSRTETTVTAAPMTASVRKYNTTPQGHVKRAQSAQSRRVS